MCATAVDMVLITKRRRTACLSAPMLDPKFLFDPSINAAMFAQKQLN
jgi:hypothetical protein